MCLENLFGSKRQDNSALIAQQDAERNRVADEERAAEDQREVDIRTGITDIDSAFGQFDDGFYDGRRQAFLDFQQPTIEDNFEEANKDLIFALARSGKGSEDSTAIERTAKLNEAYRNTNVNLQGSADQLVDETRSNVENERSSLVTALRATGDASAARDASLSRAGAIAVRPNFSPIANLFSNISLGIGGQADAERRGTSRYNTGLFGSSDGSRVVA